MDYILNDLSITQTKTKDKAKTNIFGFVNTCITAKSELSFKTLRVPESIGSLYNLVLCDEYLVSKWLHDPEVDFDIREKFRQIITTHPFIKDTEIKELDTFNTTYFYFQNQEAKGLGAAYILQTLCISFPSDTMWNTNKISIVHEQIDETGNIIKPKVIAVHGSKSEHLLSHKQYFNDLRNSFLLKCIDIWNNRIEYFPNLIFCGVTKKQLLRGIGSRYVHQIYNRLSTLNEYLNNWKEGEFNYSDFKKKHNIDCSPESNPTMRLYGDQRKFRLNDGSKEYFSLHIKTGDLRIYFLPDKKTYKAYIGYIGNHLDTVTG